VNSALLGDYNVDNALIAMTILSVLGADDAAIAAAMGQVSSISGRFDVVRGTDVTVIVDYAHTPEGLRRLLEDVRAMMPEDGLSRCSVAAATATGPNAPRWDSSPRRTPTRRSSPQITPLRVARVDH